MTTLLRTHIPTAVDSLLILYRWFRPSFLQSLLAKSAENMALTQVHYIMTYIHEAQRKKRNNKNKNESTNWHKWKCELVLFSTNTYITIHEDQCPYIAFNACILHSMPVYCIQCPYIAFNARILHSIVVVFWVNKWDLRSMFTTRLLWRNHVFTLGFTFSSFLTVLFELCWVKHVHTTTVLIGRLYTFKNGWEL